MNGNAHSAYEFGGFVLDTRQKILTRNGEVIRIAPKTFEILAYMAARPNEVISKEEIMSAVWHDSFVEDANLTVHISNIRKLFRETGSELRIETFAKKGYRFNGPILRNQLLSEGNGSPDKKSDKQLEIPVNRLEADVVSPNNQVVPRALAFGLVVIVVGLVTAFVWNTLEKPIPGAKLSVTRVPGTENSSAIALSPNGEYLGHAISVGGNRILTMTHISTGSSIQLLPPDESLFLGMTFSPDNSFLYFVKTGPETNTLYRIPILGGGATKILDNVENRISFSPNGDRFCFMRKMPPNATTIFIANSDGSGEREIARRTSPEYYTGLEISWSPDGRQIAVGAGSEVNNPKMQIVGVDVESGKETMISDSKWSGIDGLEWLRDGSGLVAGMFGDPSSPTQVWFVPFPSGEPRRITTDLENYGSVGVSADGNTVMAGQFRDNTSVWVIPSGSPDQARPVRAGKHHRFRWVRWVPDGGFIFSSDAGRFRDVWRMSLDGSGERQLTNGPDANVMPVATSDGRYVVFSAFRDNNGLFELWRMDADGSNQVKLTDGLGATQPAITPDGKWIFFKAGKMEQPPMERRIWRVSIDGREAAQFLDIPSYLPEVSPDGRFIACWIKESEKANPKVAIVSVEGGQIIKTLAIPQGNRIDWTPDGSGISYILTEKGVSNIWTQPIEGGQPKRETSFTSETITNFDWSEDGDLLCSRLLKTRDVLLIRNFR